MGVQREVSLDLLSDEEIKIGDYVLIHIGFAINKIDEEDALASLDVFHQILEKMDENERLEAING
jgi:hydrogenase expression/formation protein HypC